MDTEAFLRALENPVLVEVVGDEGPDITIVVQDDDDIESSETCPWLSLDKII
jgi:hypothetical protein